MPNRVVIRFPVQEVAPSNEFVGLLNWGLPWARGFSIALVGLGLQSFGFALYAILYGTPDSTDFLHSLSGVGALFLGLIALVALPQVSEAGKKKRELKRAEQEVTDAQDILKEKEAEIKENSDAIRKAPRDSVSNSACNSGCNYSPGKTGSGCTEKDFTEVLGNDHFFVKCDLMIAKKLFLVIFL